MADEVTFRFLQLGTHGYDFELYSDDGLFGFFKPTDIAPLAAAAMETLRAHDPAAHAALVRAAAADAGLRCLTANDGAWLFGQVEHLNAVAGVDPKALALAWRLLCGEQPSEGVKRDG